MKSFIKSEKNVILSTLMKKMKFSAPNLHCDSQSNVVWLTYFNYLALKADYDFWNLTGVWLSSAGYSLCHLKQSCSSLCSYRIHIYKKRKVTSPLWSCKHNKWQHRNLHLELGVSLIFNWKKNTISWKYIFLMPENTDYQNVNKFVKLSFVYVINSWGKWRNDTTRKE